MKIIIKRYLILVLLTLSGNWDCASEILFALLNAGFGLELAPASRLDPQSGSPIAGLQLVAVSTRSDFPIYGSRWLAWVRADEPALTLSAYNAGAQAVFPPDMPPTLLAQAVSQLTGDPNMVAHSGGLRKIRRGDQVSLDPDSVLSIHEGILVTKMVHGDGAEILLGLTGAGHILIAHPDDECCIQVLAHTSAVVSIQSWERAATLPDFTKKLRARLQQMEAWAAMQARPYLDQRVLGIFSLLAEQFGVPHPEGTLIGVRLTHAEIASAVGATRTTITRVLGELRAMGKISLDNSGEKFLFVLPSGVKFHHH